MLSLDPTNVLAGNFTLRFAGLQTFRFTILLACPSTSDYLSTIATGGSCRGDRSLSDNYLLSRLGCDRPSTDQVQLRW